MTENEKALFELLDEYAIALTETEVNAAKSKIKKELANMLLDKLISQGYKQDKAEAVVDFLTANNQNIDYSDTLNIKEDSRLYAVAADMDIFNSINKLKDYTNLLNESLGTYSLCLKLDKQMSEKGKCEPKDLKELLSVILDSSLDIVNSMPG